LLRSEPSREGYSSDETTPLFEETIFSAISYYYYSKTMSYHGIRYQRFFLPVTIALEKGLIQC
jgi:hypothetical protein